MKKTGTTETTLKQKAYEKSTNCHVNKYKRTKNLVKKCTGFSQQFNFDIILVILDKNSGRCREFHTNEHLTVPALHEATKLPQNAGSQLSSIRKYERIHAHANCAMYGKNDGKDGKDGNDENAESKDTKDDSLDEEKSI